MKKGSIKNFFSLEEPEKFRPDILGDNKKQNTNTKINTPKSISKFIDENEKDLQKTLSNCFDLIIRKIALFDLNEGKALIVYLSEFCSPDIIENTIISKLNPSANVDISIKDTEEAIKYTIGIKKEDVLEDFDKCVEAILAGNVVIFVDMLKKAFIVNLKKPPMRGIQEPSVEAVIRGPREGFTEDVNTNVSLIRKIIKNKNLKIEKLVIGKETNNDIAICYIENIADEAIVNDVKNRLKKISLNFITDSNYVVEAIEDDTIAIIPTVFRSERPDTIASKIIEGKVAIIVDTSPVVITVPALFVEFMDASDDYYIKYLPATLNKWFRYLGLFITLTLPSIYVSLIDFHQELIPTALTISTIRGRSGVPFPAPIECFLMLSAYDIIREAGLRIPKALGQTVSIVGALILGEAAVRAGIVGAPMIIVVAFAGTSLFTIPSPELNTTVTMLKYIFLILAAAFGIFGLLNGILFFIIYMISRRSFGVPYMYPIAPFCLKRNADTFIRLPTWALDNKFKLFKK